MLYKYDNKTLQFKQISIKQYVLMFLAIALIFSSLGFTGAIKLNFIVEKIPIIIHENEEKPTDENIRKYLIQTRVRFPKIVYQQIINESNYMTSFVFLNYNNLLGMENPSVRPTLGKDIGIRFAKYDNWKSSINDYIIWQSLYTSEIRTEEGYYNLLDKMYCNFQLKENKGELYSTKLKKIKY